MPVMEHSAAAHHWVTEAAALAAKEQGAGNLLRVVLIVMVVGCVLVAWFLLRGYRQGADAERGSGDAESTGKAAEPDAAPDAAPNAEPDAVPREGRAGEGDENDRADRNS
ncbi:hypothetical protein ACFWPU_31845 [Streptomyces sp. NPDC058471]|uniref:hypothetical protein n=1 Tax=Streptomyces sp. NPDC058471 TaxID=3346516 RepID=UPI003655A136